MLLHLPPMEGHGVAAAREERPAAGRARSRSRSRRDRRSDQTAAARAASLTDLGPGRGDGSARAVAHRRRSSGLLLRPAQSVAAGHQREHQRPATPVLPEGHRPEPAQRRGSRRSRVSRSTPGRARPLAGAPRPRRSTTTYCDTRPDKLSSHKGVPPSARIVFRCSAPSRALRAAPRFGHGRPLTEPALRQESHQRGAPERVRAIPACRCRLP